MAHEFLRSNRIRVLVNAIHAKSGGGVTYLKNLMPLLAEDKELEIHLFLHRDQFKIFGSIDERIRLHLLTYPNGFISNLLWEQLALPILARVMSVDVTLSPANFGPLFAPAQIIMLRNSLAVAGRETRLIKRIYWAGLTVMTALSLLTCRRAIAVSNYARRALTFGIGQRFQGKISVVNHGVQETFQPSVDPRSGGYLLAVSDIYVQKNLHTLIQALSIVRIQIPEIRIKIAGRAIDQGYLQELNKAIGEHNLEDVFEFLGEQSVDQLVELYQQCKLFIFPSTVETFGNPLVEAMACGAPIASSNTAAMPEILGDAAAFFDPLDPVEMAERIIELLEDDEARQKLSDQAIRQAKKFSWAFTAEKTAAIIKSVISKPARSADIENQAVS